MKPTAVPDFQRFQQAFARHLRDPHHAPRPAGVNARRMAVYSELLFNNVCGFLDRCFPLSRQLLGEARWRRLNRSFYRDWPLRSPLHRDICPEFVVYLRARAGERLPRWLPQLAHYEWAELAVDLMDVATPGHDPDGDLLHQPVALNPACMSLCFDWPVHRIGLGWRPRKPQATHLLVYRERDDAVRFMEINAVTARLLALLAEQPRTGEAACRKLASELQSPQPQQIVDHGAALLEQLRRQQVVLGSLR
ncbi:MAG: putative DNA-binding domain-containing protein [Hylemonella sp.]|nr:putative DNA-binding domain-containing protein [Hylemonella sp.]